MLSTRIASLRQSMNCEESLYEYTTFMPRIDAEQLLAKKNLLAVLFILALSFFTYVFNFWNPQALFWDENYHIASAQKYLNGTFFMEPHPPLGKLVIALGEKIIDANPEDNQFIGTDYATNPPAGFSFTGYRFFPVMLAWLTAPLFFAIFFLITRNTLWSLLLSFLYVFDNALLVHLRSAMLESTMLFFSALTILGFLLALEWKDDRKKIVKAALLYGFGFACVNATKAFGLIFIMFLPFIFWAMRGDVKKFLRFAWLSGLTAAIVFVGIWHMHFTLARTIHPSLPDGGYYQASAQYKAIIDAGRTSSVFAIPTMLRDSMKFVSHYEAGVPGLNLCKADENGSPWFLWPIGARTISYRWETPDGDAYRYLYLVANPAVWAIGLAGVLLSFALLGGSLLMQPKEDLKQKIALSAFFTLYVCYMIAVSRIDRVMYLYHYFLPLIFSFILFALVFNQVHTIGKWKINDERKTSILLLLSVLIFLCFQFFRAFTFYELIGDRAFERRNWSRLWELKCVNCERESMIALPSN